MPYERYESQHRRQTFGTTSRRTTFGYWVPLALTVTVATIGFATWIWKERNDDEDGDYDLHGDDSRPGDSYRDDAKPQYKDAQPTQDDPGLVARMSSALRRTPSPQQLFDEAGRRVVAAAGAAMGGALGLVKEDSRGDYEDHSRWSEEAVARSKEVERPRVDDTSHLASQPTQSSRPAERVKKVAVVVSAESDGSSSVPDEMNYTQEHTSILSHLPEHMDGGVRVFVMIYAPGLQQHPLSGISSIRPAASIASSYSNIGQEDLQTPGEEGDKPLSLEAQPSSGIGLKMFNALYSQAQTLVDKETMIMPFTTPTGYVNLLKHVNPSVVYVQGTLSGPNGDAIKEVSRWAGQVVLVVGDDTGHGGLVDSEDERVGFVESSRQWWKQDPRVGLGKGIEVVEGLRVGEDWRRRVKGHD